MHVLAERIVHVLANSHDNVDHGTWPDFSETSIREAEANRAEAFTHCGYELGCLAQVELSDAEKLELTMQEQRLEEADHPAIGYTKEGGVININTQRGAAGLAWIADWCDAMAAAVDNTPQSRLQVLLDMLDRLCELICMIAGSSCFI